MISFSFQNIGGLKDDITLSKLSSFFSTKIKIDSSNNEKGKIEIYFESIDDLNRIIELIE